MSLYVLTRANFWDENDSPEEQLENLVASSTWWTGSSHRT